MTSLITVFLTSLLGRVRRIVVSMPACLCVYLSARLSTYLFVCSLAYLKQTHVKTLRNFLCVISVAVARFFSDDNAIRYIIPFLGMTSCIHVTRANEAE